MRLIDADALMEDILKRPYIDNGLREIFETIIDEQSTAFDTEKVIEQLEVLHDLVNINQKLAVSQSIDIIKKCGVE